MEEIFGFYAAPIWLADNGTRLVCMYRIRVHGEEMLRLVDIPSKEILTVSHLLAQLTPEIFEESSPSPSY
jgi:hypothetical protein